jgi:hypothetical protein
VKTHPLALSESRKVPMVFRKQLTVSGTSIRNSPFIWATSLLDRLSTNQVQEFARVLDPRHKNRGLVKSFPGGIELPYPLECLGGMVPAGETFVGPDTLPGEARLCAASFEVAGTDGFAVHLAVGLSNQPELFGAAGRASKCPPAAVPTLMICSPLGDLDSWGVLRDDITFHPLIPSREATSLVGSGVEEPTPTGRPDTIPAHVIPSSA